MKNRLKRAESIFLKERCCLKRFSGAIVFVGYNHVRKTSSGMGRLAELAGDEASGEKSRTFVFQDEGHTLGNVLRSIIAQYPDVQFCGYTVPHPAEAKMHFRIQAKQGRAADILRRGLEDLERVCDYTGETFTTAWEKFKKSQDSMETS